MPVYRLSNEIAFPPPELAREDGLLAVGGDLGVERLLLAYAMGIFPWYGEDDPILWWSPDPRMILLPHEFKASKRLQRVVRKGAFRISLDEAFDQVIAACATTPRQGQDGTWITDEMQAAYCALHQAGYAHSVESWQDGQLVGGLYGVSLGSCFLGESMFSHVSDASKVALSALVNQLRKWQFTLIDCQIRTEHLSSLGAHEVDRSEFLRLLDQGVHADGRQGEWAFED